MTNFAEVPAEQLAIHMLLVGNTKSGKSTYVAQAAKDGHKVIYVDSDNGATALNEVLPPGHPARSNILYFNTVNPFNFLYTLMDSGKFRWNLTQDLVWSRMSAKPTDKLVELIPSRFPKGIVLAIDSWTSVSLDAMQLGAAKKGAVSLAELEDKAKQGMYEEAGRKLTILCAIIQQMKFHIITLAHGGFYERLEKPIGSVLKDVKQGDMVIKENIEIPMSCSRPHGFMMGKYFNNIGWLTIDRVGRRNLDFKVRYDRISGGTIDKVGEVEEMSFSKIFAKPQPVEFDSSWVRYLTHEELSAELDALKAQSANKGTQASSLAAGPKPTITAMLKK